MSDKFEEKAEELLNRLEAVALRRGSGLLTKLMLARARLVKVTADAMRKVDTAVRNMTEQDDGKR